MPLPLLFLYVTPPFFLFFIVLFHSQVVYASPFSLWSSDACFNPYGILAWLCLMIMQIYPACYDHHTIHGP